MAATNRRSYQGMMVHGFPRDVRDDLVAAMPEAAHRREAVLGLAALLLAAETPLEIRLAFTMAGRELESRAALAHEGFGPEAYATVAGRLLSTIAESMR